MRMLFDKFWVRGVSFWLKTIQQGALPLPTPPYTMTPLNILRVCLDELVFISMILDMIFLNLFRKRSR